MSDEALERARRHATRGEWQDLIALFGQVRGDDISDAARLEWACLLIESGQQELAGPLLIGLNAARAPGDDNQPRADGAPLDEFDADKLDADEQDPDELEQELRGSDRRTQRLDTAKQFLDWFGGRRDLYARQWYSEQRRRGGYRPVKEPLTVEVAARHLAGQVTVGQYLLFPDRGVSFAVIDLDLDASLLAEYRAANGDLAPSSHPTLQGFLKRLLAAGERLGLRLFPADSGSKGAHLWLFFSPRRTARAARTILQQVLAGCPGPPPGLSIEVFPKQDREGPRGLSSLVKLPLGVHQATARRCPLLDSRLQPIGDLDAALQTLRHAPNPTLDAILGRRLVALPAPELLVPEPPLPPVTQTLPTDGRGLSEALRATQRGKDEKQAASQVLEGCAVLRGVADKAFKQRRLSPDEARAVVYSLGLLGAGPETAGDILRAANLGLKELERVGRGMPSPVGCKRLSQLSGSGATCEVCDSCNTESVPYATPMLLGLTGVVPNTGKRRKLDPWLEPGEKLLETPIEGVARSLDAINERLQRLEARKGPDSGEPMIGTPLTTTIATVDATTATVDATPLDAPAPADPSNSGDD